MTELTSSVAGLLAAGPTPTGSRALDEQQAQRALAARDIVLGELRTLTVELTGRFADPPSLQPVDVVRNPLRVLRQVLGQLPYAIDRPDRPSDVLWSRTDLWGQAARAAVQLEATHDRVSQLPSEASRSVAGDVVKLAAALPHLDADLAGQVPARFREAGRQLAKPTAHGLMRVAAAEFGFQGSDDETENRRHHRLLDSALARPMMLRSPSDLPEGMRRVTALLEDAGADIAAVNVRGVARLLAVGVEAMQRQGVRELQPALPGLRGAAHESLATLTPLDPRLQVQASEVCRQLRGAAPGELLAWLSEASDTAAALSGTLEAAGRAKNLFCRPGEDARGHSAYVGSPSAGCGVDAPGRCRLAFDGGGTTTG